MSIQEVVVHPRERVGKQNNKRLRRSGMIPSVVYGAGEPRSISVEPKILNKIIHSEKGMNTVLFLRMSDTDKARHVMIKSVDRHPVTDRLIHVDFLRIDMNKKIAAVIPVAYEGTPEGVKLGGILTTVHYEVEIECLPKDLPGVIRVDVSGVGMDDALRVKDLPAIEGVTYLTDPESTIAVVHAPRVEEEEVEEEEVEEVVAEEAPEETEET